MKMQRFSRRRFLFILCFGLILIMALLWMVLSINKRRYVHIGQLLDVTEELPLSTANNLNPDDSISIRVTSLEWHPEQQNGCKVSYEIRNDAGRQFLIVLSGGIIECSSDGKAWYPFANERMAYLQDDSRMLYAMGWMISFAFGRYEPFYLPPGTSFNSFYFHLDEDLMESAIESRKSTELSTLDNTHKLRKESQNET